MRILRNILPIMLLAAIGLYYYYLQSMPSHEEKAPDFETTLVDGTAFSLSDLEGEYVLLDFWGSWCAPCRKDNPNLVKLHDEFAGSTFKDADGFKVVTVALERDNKRWERAAQRDGFKWKHQIVDISRVVMLSSLAQKYRVSEVPAKFLIGPNGHIIGANQSYEEIRTFLSNNLQ